MLNNDAMAQLQGLKQKIESQKEHAEATVKGYAKPLRICCRR